MSQHQAVLNHSAMYPRKPYHEMAFPQCKLSTENLNLGNLAAGSNTDVSGGTFPLRTEADWQRIQRIVSGFKELASIEIDYQR